AVYTAPRPTVLDANRRKDSWWVRPLTIGLTLSVFLIYATWRLLEHRYRDTVAFGAHYISPFYALPEPNWPVFQWPLFAALYALAIPGAFRGSCYFCRRTMYRAFFGDPSACAVKEIIHRRNYTGERQFPFSLFNLHRFALYAVLILIALHWKHLGDAFFFKNERGEAHFGVGLGTLLLTFDTLMLTAYAASCHSFRHLMGSI